MGKPKVLLYNIQVQQKDDGWFVVTVPDLYPVTTLAARLEEVEYLARHAIGQWLERDPRTIEVKIVE